MTIKNRNRADNESKKFHNPSKDEALVETRVLKNSPARTLLELKEIEQFGLFTANLITLNGEVVTTKEGELLYAPTIG